MTRLNTIIKESIRELIKDYEDSEFSYLTESDAMAGLLSILRMKLGSEFVHSELRPLDSKGRVISGRPRKWRKKGKGCVVDIAIVREKHIKKTIEERQKKVMAILVIPCQSLPGSSGSESPSLEE